MRYLQNMILIIFLFSNLYSERIKDRDHKLIERIKNENSKTSGSMSAERKPVPISYLPEILVQKCIEYFRKIGSENTISIINKKPRKFRDFKTYLFIIDIKGNILAHSGNPHFVGKNMLSTKDSRGHFFIQEYIDRTQQNNSVNYINWEISENNLQFAFNYIYLEKINQNLIIGAVAKP